MTYIAIIRDGDSYFWVIRQLLKQDILSTFIIPETLPEIYRQIPEERRLLQIISYKSISNLV